MMLLERGRVQVVKAPSVHSSNFSRELSAQDFLTLLSSSSLAIGADAFGPSLALVPKETI